MSIDHRIRVQNTNCWTAIAPAGFHERVQIVVRHIADAVCNTIADDKLRPVIHLGGGSAGIGMFLAYAARYLNDARYFEHAEMLVDHTMRMLSRVGMGLGLFSGLAGISWATDHTLHILGDIDTTDTATDEDIDEAILQHTRGGPWTGNYDLMAGLVGLGWFGLQRAQRARGGEIFAAVVARLDELSERIPAGRVWKTPPEMTSELYRERHPNRPRLDLGIAHGLPGVVALLAEGIRHGFVGDSIDEMLSDSVDALIALKVPARSASAYSYEVDAPEPARAAWCYGDPSVQIALLRAAVATSRLDWWEEAINLAKRTENRPIESMGIVDQGLCHGMAGVAHIANSMFQVTGDPASKRHAERMFERTMQMCEREPGVPRDFWNDEYPRNTVIQSQIGFEYLTGAAGTGLALISAASSERPHWDKPLMIGIHVAHGRTN